MRKILALLLVYISTASMMMAPCAAAGRISWTDNEMAFMEEHPVIRLGVDPNFVPFEFFDEDEAYEGIAADYLSLIKERTGLHFEIVEGLTWPEAYHMALSRDIDVLPAVSRTHERERFFLFSEPYIHFNRVIVTRDVDTGITDIDDLPGLTVAVQRNSSHHSYLLNDPNINLSLYDSAEAALIAVAHGTERAFVGNLATTNYLVRSNALTNLRFIAFEGEKQQAIYFAVRKDWPELVGILNKALADITEEEKNAIKTRWIDFESNINYGPVLRIVLFGGSILAVVMMVSFLWIIRLRKEIKKRRLIQADLEKAKREADEANEFKSSFMARMSHEIRTPLNAITGMSYLLKKTDLALIQRMYVDRITQASHNMLSIINDILDFSRIEARKVELEVASFSMDQVIEDVVNIVSYKIEEQGIDFKFLKDSLVPNWFYGDAKRIEQILVNLLNNAAKFTSQGEVSLDVRLVARENDTYHLSFSVQDTGIGMTQEQIRNLFKPFIQGDSSITRRFGGSGLGLSIVKNLVDMMGGEIQVFSTPAVGSTFIIHLSLGIDKEKEESCLKTLPAKHLKDNRGLVIAPEARLASESKLTGRVRAIKTYGVLLAEDNKTNQLIVQSLLGQAGIEMFLAGDGKAAIEMYQHHHNDIHLILMDLHMPVMDGYEAAREIRRISADVPIVAMTADVVEGVREKCEQSGIHYCISKPFDPDDFIPAILDIIGGQEGKGFKVCILDTSAGLRNVGGNTEVYKQVLSEFYNENREILDKLSLAVSEKRYGDAVQIVHKIRGSSGSIGARDVYEVSATLQRALREENENHIPLLKEKFLQLFGQLLEEIIQYLK